MRRLRSRSSRATRATPASAANSGRWRGRGSRLTSSSSSNSRAKTARSSSRGWPLRSVLPRRASRQSVSVMSSTRSGGASSARKCSSVSPSARQRWGMPGGTVAPSPAASVRRRPPSSSPIHPASSSKRASLRRWVCSMSAPPPGRIHISTRARRPPVSVVVRCHLHRFPWSESMDSTFAPPAPPGNPGNPWTTPGIRTPGSLAPPPGSASSRSRLRMCSWLGARASSPPRRTP